MNERSNMNTTNEQQEERRNWPGLSLPELYKLVAYYKKNPLRSEEGKPWTAKELTDFDKAVKDLKMEERKAKGQLKEVKPLDPTSNCSPSDEISPAPNKNKWVRVGNGVNVNSAFSDYFYTIEGGKPFTHYYGEKQPVYLSASETEELKEAWALLMSPDAEQKEPEETFTLEPATSQAPLEVIREISRGMREAFSARPSRKAQAGYCSNNTSHTTCTTHGDTSIIHAPEQTKPDVCWRFLAHKKNRIDIERCRAEMQVAGVDTRTVRATVKKLKGNRYKVTVYGWYEISAMPRAQKLAKGLSLD